MNGSDRWNTEHIGNGEEKRQIQAPVGQVKKKKKGGLSHLLRK